MAPPTAASGPGWEVGGCVGHYINSSERRRERICPAAASSRGRGANHAHGLARIATAAAGTWVGWGVAEMEWEWYHYIGCILLGIAFKLFKRAVGMDRPRGQMFRQQEDVVLSSKRVN